MALIDIAILVAVITTVYLLMSIGLTIQWGDTGIMNFGLAAFFGIGGYATVLLTTPPSPSPIYDRVVGFDFPIVVGFIAAFVVASVIGGLIALSSIRVRGDYLAIVLLAFDRIAAVVFSTESWLTSGIRGVTDVPRIATMGTEAEYNFVYLVFALIVVAVAYYGTTRLSRSPFGQVLRAIREDEEATQALGKRTTVYKLKAFAIGSGLAGLSGALMAHYLGVFGPQAFQLNLTFLIWTAVIIGGSSSYRGAILGTAVVMSLYQLVRFVPQNIPLGEELPHIRLLLVGVVLILIMYYRPYGLLGDREQMSAGGLSL